MCMFWNEISMAHALRHTAGGRASVKKAPARFARALINADGYCAFPFSNSFR